MLAAPALLAWSVIGATSGIGRGGRFLELNGGKRIAVVGALVLLPALGLTRSVAQWTAITLVGQGGTRAGWIAGAEWDPGSYRANLNAARLQANGRRCTSARRYASRALALAPDAAEPKRVLRACR